MSEKPVKGIRMIKKKKGNCWRVERTVNGVKFDKSFTRECDAIAYSDMLETMVVSHSGSNGHLQKIKLGKLITDAIQEMRSFNDDMTCRKSISISQHFSHLFDADYLSMTDEEILKVFSNAKNLKTGEKLAQNTLINLKVFLIKIIEKAEDHGYIRKNKNVLIKSVKQIAGQGTPPSPKQHYRKKQVVQWFHSEELDDFWVRTMALVLITTSLRIGEVLGMTWNHMDWKNKRYYVCQMVTSDRFSPRLKKNAPFHYKELDDAVIERLKLLKEMQEAMGINSDWVFPSPLEDVKDFPDCPYKGRAMSYDMARKHIQRDQKNAGLDPIRLHGCRITSATLEYIRLEGTPLAWDRVKAKLNHKSKATTEGYIQIAMEDIEAAEKESKKESLVDFCFGKNKKENEVLPEVHNLQKDEDDLDRLIAIEEKRLKLLELRKKAEELEKSKVGVAV